MKRLINGENLQFLFREKNNNGAEFTVMSLLTGKDYTFSISRSKFGNNWFTYVYVELGYQNFIRLGTYFNGRITNKKVLVDTPAAKAIAWILRKVQSRSFAELTSNIEIMHIGACLVCGKALTDANSIERGIGPVCARS